MTRTKDGKQTEEQIKGRMGELKNRRRTDHYSLHAEQGPNYDVKGVNIEWCSLPRKPIQKIFVLDY